jgi:transcriptional regulator with PAS, ATPase and Fis domain/predicted negative regulator of RcsB-dependent stress response
VWLECRAANVATAIAIMKGEYEDGVNHAQRALALAEQSGATGLLKAASANLGNLFFELGEFDRAVAFFERAMTAHPTHDKYHAGEWDSLALIRIVQGKLECAADLLRQIQGSVVSENDWRLYANRHSRLTLTLLLIRQGHFEEAARCADAGIDLAHVTGDRLLGTSLVIRKAEALIACSKFDEALDLLDVAAESLPLFAGHLNAEYERTLGQAFAMHGDELRANRHFTRAIRFCRAIHSSPGVVETLRSQESLLAVKNVAGSTHGTTDGDAQRLLQEIAALVMHAGRPELLAAGLMTILQDTGCVAGARSVSRVADEAERPLCSFGTITRRGVVRTLTLGTSGNRTFEVTLEPLPDIESRVTLNAISFLLGNIRDLERAQAEREEQLTLSPDDEPPDSAELSSAVGTMRGAMQFAQKVARANVLVLITGESGTGKEVLARSIHRASPRAAKPFVPFNCAAVPRELLESQLFGHRRGAFTGAERDSPGVIRAARDGTLFLDEIGELGLDLQPKLLRFLESSEINPLGESTPFRVDVRIVAATNANLDDLVHQGKFREDLFYRLNVIRLSIPPLRERREEIPALVHHFIARAATEFNKGRMRIAEEAMEHLLLFRWPGNVRQLQNEIRRMVALADPDSVLRPSMIDPLILRATPKASPPPETPDMAVSLHDNLPATITRIEREMIERALKAHDGKVDAVARALGISRKGLYLKRQRLGL